MPLDVLIRELSLATTFLLTAPQIDTSPEDLVCLTKNIYFEARGESFEGQLAVANVTLNRGKNICDVVLAPGQFSWTEDGLSDLPTDWDAYTMAMIVALDALVDPYDPSLGSTYYYAGDVPYWASSFELASVIGGHTFMKGFYQ